MSLSTKLYNFFLWLLLQNDSVFPLRFHVHGARQGEHTKLNHGIRKFNKTEDGFTWKSELETASSKIAINFKDWLFFYHGRIHRIVLSLCSYFKYPGRCKIFWEM